MDDTHAGLSPLKAYESVLGFAAARGENALRLALHAALPQVLTPELLHLIRLNFVPEALDDLAAEADVLFAPFTEEMGNGYFRFDPNARLHLLTQLDPAYTGDREPRSRQVAGFMLAWCRREGEKIAAAEDRVHTAFLDVERWVALAFRDPDAAATQLAAAVKEASEDRPAAARLRIGGLASALATPLAGHGRLLAYAAGLEALELGDIGRAEDLLEPFGDQELRVGEIVLKPPRVLLQERGRGVAPRVEELLAPDPEAELEREAESETARPEVQMPAAIEESSGVPPDVSDPVEQEVIFISYSHADEKSLFEIERYLKPIARKHHLTIWSNRIRLSHFETFESRLEKSIEKSRVAVALVSSHYLATDHLMDSEFRKLLEKSERSDLKITWVCLDQCLWTETPFASLQAAYDAYKPLSELRSNAKSKAWTEIARKIGQFLEAPKEAQPDTRRSARLRIYVSSTFKDLEEHRKAVKATLERAGFDVECMEKYPAFDERPADKCLADVADCDYYVLVLAWRYGYQPKEGNPKKLSITHMEYEEALRRGKPCFAFLLHPEYTWPARLFDANSVSSRSKIGKFRNLIENSHGRRIFTTPDSLAAGVLEALRAWERQGERDTTINVPDSKSTFPPEIQSLLAELDLPETLDRRRLEIGDTLDKLSDPRPGVGLRPDGVPDIVWLEVPGGMVRLEGIGKTFEVRPFRIARYPVTYRQYWVFLDDPEGYANPAWWEGLRRERKPGKQRLTLGNRPAERVSWYDAMAYCRWLSARLGYEVRLPTEMEWQQAATAGEPDREYPWGKTWNGARANTAESGLGQTTAVGLYPAGASPCGALDLAGNVWEWCLNEYHHPERTGPEGNEWRAVRGGSWDYARVDARCASRYDGAPVGRNSGLGLRLVCVPPIA